MYKLLYSNSLFNIFRVMVNSRQRYAVKLCNIEIVLCIKRYTNLYAVLLTLPSVVRVGCIFCAYEWSVASVQAILAETAVAHP